jgi:CRISPR-associated protein Csm5
MMLELTIKTPTFVLGGGRLMEGVDFVVLNNNLYVLDLNKLPIDQVIRNPRTSFDSLIRDFVMRDPMKYSSRTYRVEEQCGSGEVLDHNPEGIPASEVKGFLRTAYLYWLLKNDADKRTRFLGIVRERIGEGVALNRVSTDAEDMALVVSDKVLYEEEVKEMTYNVMNKVIIKQVTRPGPTNYGVYCIRDREGRFSIRALGLRPGTVIRYELIIDKRREYLNQDLIRALREFSTDLVAFESRRGVRAPGCGDGSPIRVGYGVGRRWKTVLNLLESLDPALLRDVINYVSSKLGRAWGDSTIRLANNEPVGWVCVRVVT